MLWWVCVVIGAYAGHSSWVHAVSSALAGQDHPPVHPRQGDGVRGHCCSLPSAHAQEAVMGRPV
jgi:hypothetical protein